MIFKNFLVGAPPQNFGAPTALYLDDPLVRVPHL
jgi:hypothetical protein